MLVFWFELEHIVELGDVSTDASMANGELDQHFDEVKAHSPSFGHQVIETATSFTLSIDRGAS